jgi:hypothetical protein
MTSDAQPLLNRWVIVQHGQVVGRVDAHSREIAFLCAGTMFPDGPVSLEPYAEAGKKRIKAAKRGMLVRPEMCTRLWANPKKQRETSAAAQP